MYNYLQMRQQHKRVLTTRPACQPSLASCLLSLGESLPSVFDAYSQSLKALLSQPAASGSESHVPGAVSEEKYPVTVAVSDEHGAKTHMLISFVLTVVRIRMEVVDSSNGMSPSISGSIGLPPHICMSPDELSTSVTSQTRCEHVTHCDMRVLPS
ncbi:hypothetical protein Tco_0098052 [Tanacetum coccineum]